MNKQEFDYWFDNWYEALRYATKRKLQNWEIIKIAENKFDIVDKTTKLSIR